ncbi:MAG TPA: DUF3040 domain-containing protein, partial [Actinomycetota bacterium]|nr:DUF3040 domain-containing protein [Actinomycetota bacterium]
MTVPLSEREQQILHEMEKNLVAEDPNLADLGGREGGSRGKLGVLAFLAGIVLLFIFFVSQLWFVGLAAFGAMVAG